MLSSGEKLGPEGRSLRKLVPGTPLLSSSFLGLFSWGGRATGVGRRTMNSRRSADRARRQRGPATIATVNVDLSALNDPLIVSALSETPNRSGRYRVAINGVGIGDVTIDFVADSGVREGTTITREQAVEVVAAAQRTAVLDKALDLLAVRARSSRDLGIRLRRAGAQGARYLLGRGATRRAGICRRCCVCTKESPRAKALAGGVSRRKVITVLRQKGVAQDVATAAIDETLAEVDHDEYGAALAAAEKRMRALGSLEPAKRRQRLYAFLARRGYESDVVRRVLAEVLRYERARRAIRDHEFRTTPAPSVHRARGCIG